MPITTSNLFRGPAELYTGAIDAVDPISATTAIDAAYTSLGATVGGSTLTLSTTYAPLVCDQTRMPGGSTATESTISIATTLGEVTLENLRTVLNGGTITSATGTRTFDPDFGTVGKQPGYVKVLMVGAGPSGKRIIIGRKALSTEDTDLSFSKEDQQVMPVTFTLHAISDAVLPIRIIEEDPA